jgi:hydrogenase maturation factor
MRNEIMARVNPEQIDLLTKIVEAYDNLGIVSTIEQTSGKVCIRVTADTWEEMLEILHNLPFPIELNTVNPV